MTNKLLLLDGSSILSRNYYGSMPKSFKNAKTKEEREKAMSDVMKTSDGLYTNGLYGLVRFLFKLIKEQNPSHMAIAWDVSRDTFRKTLYPDYKGTRNETPYALKMQFELAQKTLAYMGFKQYKTATHEADDIIGTFAKKFEQHMPTYIITGDQDALQLVNEHTNVWFTTSKASEWYEARGVNAKMLPIPAKVFEYTVETVFEDYGLYPKQIIDLKALEGDTSDNIPGVKGVGPKATGPLLQHYGTIERIYEAIETTPTKELNSFLKETLGITRSPIGSLTKEPTKEAPLVGKKAAFLSKQLATIDCAIPLYKDVQLEHLQVQLKPANITKIFDRLEFQSLVQLA